MTEGYGMEPSEQLGIKEARERFSELVMRAETGKTIEILRHGVPVAKLVAVHRPKMKQKDVFAKNRELLRLTKPYQRKDDLDVVSLMRRNDEL
jgi:prevent-host-death family protein